MSEWFEARAPIEVKSGIKAQSKRGAFAQKWWGKRWLEVLHNFNIASRLARGRSYARKGQVAALTIDKGIVSASVQGSRKAAYKVTIKLKAFGVRQWGSVLDKLLEQPIYSARLLNNEMPEEIESLFTDAGLSLFPTTNSDLQTDCSCPDWSNPCKHIAAVYYLMAEAFDTDPFLLLKLRGMDREQFLEELGSLLPQDTTAPETERIPLPLTAMGFWHGLAVETPDRSPEKAPPKIHAALPKRLGALKFWRGNQPMLEQLERMYAAINRGETD